MFDYIEILVVSSLMSLSLSMRWLAINIRGLIEGSFTFYNLVCLMINDGWKKSKTVLNYIYGMKKNKNEQKELTISQKIAAIKKELKDKDISWSEQEKIWDRYEFMLSYKGWFMLCKIYIEYPYECKFRLIWTPKYNKCSIGNFVDNVCEVLLHWFNIDWEPEYEDTELQ